MNLIIIENFIKAPKKIFDFFPPAAHLYYSLKNKVKFDLWQSNEDPSQRIPDDSEISEISNLLKLRREISLDKPEPYLRIGQKKFFTRFLGKKDYFIAYVLDEVSPARYQCYIIAILQRT